MSPARRIAYFSPLPPAHTGIADYSAELLPHLAAHAEITLFADDPEGVAPVLRARFPVAPTASFAARRWEFDLPLYQMGNSDHHAGLHAVLCQHPGIVVLHDYLLHHFVAATTIARADFPGYLRELGYARGAEGVALACRVRDGLAPVPFFDLPLNERILDLSLGAIVHSEAVAGQVRQRHPALPVGVVPAPIAPLGGRAQGRADLGWPDDALIFASVGQVTAVKQLPLALRAFRALRERLPQARYLIVGEAVPAEVDLAALLDELALHGAVHVTGFIESLPAFVDWIATADVVLNLRAPTVGETSATALRALAAGRPLVVFDHGWYSEIPDDCCVKVPVGDEVALTTALAQLAADPAWRQALGERAAHYAAHRHSLTAAAAAYATFIERLLAGLDARFAGAVGARG